VDIDQGRFARQKQFGALSEQADAFAKLGCGGIGRANVENLPRTGERGTEVRFCVCGNAKSRNRAFTPLQRAGHAPVVCCGSQNIQYWIRLRLLCQATPFFLRGRAICARTRAGARFRPGVCLYENSLFYARRTSRLGSR
jgi:hypothetical protein